MREHFGHADGGFRGSAGMGIRRHSARDFAGANHHDHDVVAARQRGELDIALHRRALAGAHIHIINEERREIGARADEGLL